MKIKEAEYIEVKRIVKERVSDEIYGCDECGLVIDFNDKNTEYLKLDVHSNTKPYSSHEFCSWECVLKYLPKVKTDYFVTFPFLHYDRKGVTSAKELIRLLKQ